MKPFNYILLIIWVLIAIPSIVFAQKKSKAVCNRECPSGYICGFGEMDDNSSNDKANVKKIAVNYARTEFASTIITFVESNSELNIKEQDGNAEELYQLSAKFETRFKEENVRVDGPYECSDGLWTARAIKKKNEVYGEIFNHNQEKQRKSDEYLEYAGMSTSYGDKIRNLFHAFVYNKSQFKSNTVYKGKRIYEDNSAQIDNEIIAISNSLKLQVIHPLSLALNESINGGKIKIELTAKGGIVNSTTRPSLTLMAELKKGLVNTEERYWEEDRIAKIPIEYGEGKITIEEVLSPQNIEIDIKLDLTQYDPEEYLYDELGYPRSNRVNPSDVFAKAFNKTEQKVKINVISKTWEMDASKGIIQVLTPGYKKPLEVKINGEPKGRTSGGKFMSKRLPYSFYIVELFGLSGSEERIIPVKNMVKLIEQKKYLQYEIEKMTSFIDFIPLNNSDPIEIHIQGINNNLNTKLNFQDQIDETTIDRKYIRNIPPNRIELNSGSYNIFLTKQGEQTTALYNNSLTWAGAQRNIKVQIQKPPFNRKMLEFVPFVKPYICNQSDNNKLIKTSVLALLSYMTYNSFIKFNDAEKYFINKKDEYENLRDVEQGVFDDYRLNVSTAHSDYQSANNTFNYITIGLGITYAYTILF